MKKQQEFKLQIYNASHSQTINNSKNAHKWGHAKQTEAHIHTNTKRELYWTIHTPQFIYTHSSSTEKDWSNLSSRANSAQFQYLIKCKTKTEGEKTRETNKQKRTFCCCLYSRQIFYWLNNLSNVYCLLLQYTQIK